MEKTAELIVAKRKPILIFMLLFCLLCAFWALKVPINSDMTEYLPGDSPMKKGMDLMAEEFPDLSMPQTIRVMTENLPEDEEEAFLAQLKEIPDVSSAVLTEKKDAFSLFTVGTGYAYGSPEERALEKALASLDVPGTSITVKNDEATGMDIPGSVFILAAAVLLTVLFVLCPSWTEPFLFLATIGIAIVMNMGTNILLGTVSKITWSISAILQLVLSMDYSIILMTRYRQEKDAQAKEAGGTAAFSPQQAMSRALKRALPSIAGSGFTTLIGLLTLVFMHFKLGKDIGLVLAKGVFLSMVCVFTILPALILCFDRLVEKTKKKVPVIPTGGLADLAYRFRYVLLTGFVILFGITWYLQSFSDTSFTLNPKDPIAEIFPPNNPIVFIFHNEDEEEMAKLASELEQKDNITSVLGYVTTVGKQMTAPEMDHYIHEMISGDASSLASGLSGEDFDLDFSNADQMLSGVNASSLQMVYTLCGADDTMSIRELFDFAVKNLNHPLVSRLIGKDLKKSLENAGDIMDRIVSQLKGPSCSLLMLSTTLPVESEETSSFIRGLKDEASSRLRMDYYLIGNSCMGEEMKDNFGSEFLLISLLTAASIFLVIAVTFRKLIIPLILVLLVQCGVFLTIMTTWLLGYKMYYLAVLIVQCILMGATVDYGILFTNYYRDCRQRLSIAESLKETYVCSLHTILTSSLFMIFGTGSIGFSPVDPTIAQICQSIALGAASATLLVLFVLPGVLAALDRFVVKKQIKAPDPGV